MANNEIQDSEMPQQGASKFLKGIDVKGKLVPATIKAVGQSTFQSDGESKTVRTLDVEVGKDIKTFSLNKTNIQTMVEAFGKNVDSWVNKKITLTSTQKTNPKNGASVDSIMIVAQA
ncbi:MAG: hypothetical protein ACREBJ_13185 [Nitrosotalea sp.]